jgi:hypothetical protein
MQGVAWESLDLARVARGNHSLSASGRPRLQCAVNPSLVERRPYWIFRVNRMKGCNEAKRAQDNVLGKPKIVRRQVVGDQKQRLSHGCHHHLKGIISLVCGPPGVALKGDREPLEHRLTFRQVQLLEMLKNHLQ